MNKNYICIDFEKNIGKDREIKKCKELQVSDLLLIISPFSICSDAFPYFSLPFCPPGGENHILLFI